MEKKTLENMERRMVKDFLDIIVLIQLKSSRWVSGYDILEFVHRKFGFLVSAGTVYSLLYAMERKGLVKGEFAEGKRVYSITDQGKRGIEDILSLKTEIPVFMRGLLTVGDLH